MAPLSPQEIVAQAGRSRQLRRQRYAFYRLWWSRVTGHAGPPARYNKIKARIDLLSSYLYAPESTQSSAYLPPDVLQEYAERLDLVRDAFVREWEDSGADLALAMAVEEACIVSATILKVVPEG